MGKILSGEDQKDIVRRVEKGLAAQFEIYSWEQMLRDIELNAEELEWAKEHTFPQVGIC